MKANNTELPNIERRSTINVESLETREADSKTTLIGYAAVFNTETDLGWYREKVDARAFTRSLTEGDDIRALVDHDTGISQVIGRRSVDTLRLSEDDRGLRIEIDLPNTTVGRDLAEQIKNGNIDGMSFGFRVREDSWEYLEDVDIRTLLDVELIEVSVVTFPAYIDTSVAQRSLDAIKHSSRATTSNETLRLRQKLRKRKNPKNA